MITMEQEGRMGDPRVLSCPSSFYTTLLAFYILSVYRIEYSILYLLYRRIPCAQNKINVGMFRLRTTI